MNNNNDKFLSKIEINGCYVNNGKYGWVFKESCGTQSIRIQKILYLAISRVQTVYAEGAQHSILRVGARAPVSIRYILYYLILYYIILHQYNNFFNYHNKLQPFKLYLDFIPS